MRLLVPALVFGLCGLVGCASGESNVQVVTDAGATDLGSPVDTPSTGVNCGAVTQCGTCTSLGPCGWCAGTNTCVAGSATGPAVGACAGAWSFSPAMCPAPVDAGTPPTDTGNATDAGTVATDAGIAVDAGDPCATNTTCGSCTAESSCGFCRGTGRCQTGTRDAPTAGGACASGWSWLSTDCSSTDAGTATDAGALADAGDPCASATNCATCTQRSQCGWCPGANRCLTGTGTGPNSGAATCGTWAWYSGQCSGSDGGTSTDAGAATDAGDPCVSATSCSTCTARSQCGWCPGANRCAVGTSSGPSGTVAACGTWAWISSACTATDAGVVNDAGTPSIPGFGNPASFNPADVARACPAGATLRLAVARVYATPRKPSGSPWDGIAGISDFVCPAAADQVRTALRDQLNNQRMGVGTTVDTIVGDAFHGVVASQCGTAIDWFLGRWEGPDMFAQLHNPATATSTVWRTPTENDSWEAPRVGATWPTAYVDIPCSALGATLYGLDVRDHDPIPPDDPVGQIDFRGSEVSPHAICTGWAFHEGVDGLAGVLFTAHVTGGTQNCTGL